MGKEAFLDFSLGIIDEAEYINKLIKGLEFTVPYSCIRREGEKYFTMQEINYLHSITLGCKNHPKLKEEIIVFLENYFSQYMDSEMEAVIAGHFEYIMEKVQSALGNKGDFEKSNAYSKYLIRESLRNRRIFPLFSSLYNIWWNNKEQNGFNPADNSLLERCKDIAEIGKNTEQLHFIEKKIG